MKRATRIAHDIVSVPSDPTKEVQVVGHVLADTDALPHVSLSAGDDRIAQKVNAWIQRGTTLSLRRQPKMCMTTKYGDRPHQWRLLHHILHELSEGRYHLVRHRTNETIIRPRSRKKALALSQ